MTAWFSVHFCTGEPDDLGDVAALAAKHMFPDSLGSTHMQNRTITVDGADVTITTRHEQDYISLTDMMKRFGDDSIPYG